MTHTTRHFLQNLVDFLYAIRPQRRPAPDRFAHAKVVAHRGVHDNRLVDENTLEAFQLALNLKLWGVELDVRWTSDLVPVVIHDTNTTRVFGKSLTIGKAPFANLRHQFPEIPTLAEVIDLCAGKIHLMLELKSEVFPAPQQQKKILQDILGNLSPGKEFHILSLEPHVIETFNIFPPSTYILVAETNTRKIFELIRERQLGGMAGHYALCRTDILRELKRHDRKIGTGFVSSRNVLNRELERGVDWIFTNHASFIMREIAKNIALAQALQSRVIAEPIQ